MSEQMIPGTPATPADITAILAAMQDQIDDLTAVVAAHQRRLDQLGAASWSPRGAGPARSR
jgi:hypothetical protein